MLLEDEVDVSRGDFICRRGNQPTTDARVRGDGLLDVATASSSPAAATRSSTRPAPRAPSWRTCATRSTSTPSTATRRRRRSGLNEIGRVRLKTSVPLLIDDYRTNRSTGSFILIDEGTNDTVGAGMILGPEQQ